MASDDDGQGSANVTHIHAAHGATVPASLGRADPRVVEVLREALARAERGELAAVAIAGVRPDMIITSAYHAPGSVFSLLLDASIMGMYRRYVKGENCEHT